MNSVIKLMSTKLANMIAAGEVVERPLNVIKELVENSIDANSKNIIIELKEGGLKYIKVEDDGIGMIKDDLLKSFLRHATSKVSEINDLENIKTLGFRGEALAAISSVSNVEITSRYQNSEHAYRISICDKDQNIEEVSANQGTTVIVTNLFYNTPARFKFLKNSKLEKEKSILICKQLALSMPNISFKLIIDEKIIFQTSGRSDYYELFRNLYDERIAVNMIALNSKIQGLSIQGFLINPIITKSNRNDISIFLNGRYIKNFHLINSVIKAFNSYLMHNRYPICVFYINTSTQYLDVNVHPQKLEVKIANEYLIGFYLNKDIETLLKTSNLKVNEVTKLNIKLLEDNFSIEKNSYEPVVYRQENSLDKRETTQDDEEIPLVNFLTLNDILSENKKNQEDNNIIKYSKNEFSFNKEYAKLPFLEYIGQLGATYLLYQNEDGLFLIDQHAAAERIRYEDILKDFSRDGSDQVMQLLVPLEIELSDFNNELYQKFADNFKILGFEILKKELITKPSWLNDKYIIEVIEFIFENLALDQMVTKSLILDEFAKTKSCKGAIKANHRLSQLEINSLHANLEKCENPYTCPHGRPIIVKITYYEIEKFFKRII